MNDLFAVIVDPIFRTQFRQTLRVPDRFRNPRRWHHNLHRFARGLNCFDPFDRRHQTTANKGSIVIYDTRDRVKLLVANLDHRAVRTKPLMRLVVDTAIDAHGRRTVLC